MGSGRKYRRTLLEIADASVLGGVSAAADASRTTIDSLSYETYWIRMTTYDFFDSTAEFLKL